MNFLHSRQKSNINLFLMVDSYFDFVPLKISLKERHFLVTVFFFFFARIWICNRIDKFPFLKIWPQVVFWPEKCTVAGKKNKGRGGKNQKRLNNIHPCISFSATSTFIATKRFIKSWKNQWLNGAVKICKQSTQTASV